MFYELKTTPTHEVTSQPYSPVCIAAFRGHLEMVRLLAELGANVETCVVSTPAFVAAQNGHTEVMRLLMDLGVNVEIPIENGATPGTLERKFL